MTDQYPQYPPYEEPMTSWPGAEPEPSTGGRHRVNIGHLVMGVAFLQLMIVWALFVSDTVSVDDLRWLMPLPWVAAGVVGIVASVVSGRRDRAATMWE